MHEQHAAATAHHPPRRNRRVDAPRQQAHDAAAGADRKPAGPAILAEEIERLVGERLDVNRQLRVRQVHRPVARFLDPAADLTLDLGRRQRKALVGAARRQPERRGRRVAEIFEDGHGNRLDVERRPAGFREVADAEHARQPIPHHAPVRRRARTISIRPISTRTAFTSRSDNAARRLRTSRATNHGRFSTLESDFLVMDYYGLHSHLDCSRLRLRAKWPAKMGILRRLKASQEIRS